MPCDTDIDAVGCDAMTLQPVCILFAIRCDAMPSTDRSSQCIANKMLEYQLDSVNVVRCDASFELGNAMRRDDSHSHGRAMAMRMLRCSLACMLDSRSWLSRV